MLAKTIYLKKGLKVVFISSYGTFSGISRYKSKRLQDAYTMHRGMGVGCQWGPPCGLIHPWHLYKRNKLPSWLSNYYFIQDLPSFGYFIKYTYTIYCNKQNSSVINSTITKFSLWWHCQQCVNSAILHVLDCIMFCWDGQNIRNISEYNAVQ